MTVLLESIFLRHCRRPPLFSAAALAVFIVLSLMGPTASAKPKLEGTLQFIYYVSETKEQTEIAARVVNYTAQRAWLATHEGDSEAFPREFRRDLNGDGRPEAFLRVLEHAHFAEYNIFTRRGKKWIHIGACAYGGNRLVRLAQTHAGWHNFYADINGPRDSLERRYFRFDGQDKSYDLSNIITIRHIPPDEP